VAVVVVLEHLQLQEEALRVKEVLAVAEVRRFHLRLMVATEVLAEEVVQEEALQIQLV
jgi:hypothetical protein